MTLSNSSSVTSNVGLFLYDVPALLTRMSNPPNLSLAVSTSFFQSAEEVTLAVTVATWAASGDDEEKFFSRPEVFMSAATTLAPSARNFFVVARPKPDAAPGGGGCQTVVQGCGRGAG
jgi:hypothetical protein